MTRRKAQPKQQPKQSGRQGSKQPQKPPKGAKARQAAAAKRNRQVGIGAIAAVAVVVVAIIVFSAKGTPSASPTPSADTAQVAKLVTTVPSTTLDQIGAGQGITEVQTLPSGTAPLTLGGKPEVFYLGAEYCPYCAAQRWPLVIALSRFGTFSGLGTTTSSSTDTAPNTPTLSFHGSTYTSSYLSLAAVETQTQAGKPLDTPTAAQQHLASTYDPPSQGSSGSPIPFLMIGNRYMQIGSSYLPTALAGMTSLQVATALSDPSAPTTKPIVAAANMFTAAFCQLTSDQPQNVCAAPGVRLAAAKLPSAGP